MSWRGRSGSRGWAFALTVMLAVALAGCARKIELMAAIPESEANEVLGALQNAGIAADKVPGKEGMVGLQIQADQVGRAVDLLREQGLPRERFSGMGEVFKKEGLISSPMEERARYLYALSQELAATLNQIDGVIVARVHVVLPERSSTGEGTQPASAAVFLKYQDGYDLEGLQPLVRRLVANSIPGLSPDKLTLVMVPSQPPRMRQGGGGGAPSSLSAAGDVTGRTSSASGEGHPSIPSAAATSQASPQASSPGAGVKLLLLFVGVLALASAGGVVAWRSGRIHRWLPAPLRARLGLR